MARKKQDKPMGKRASTDRPAWIRASGIGFEFAGAVAGFTLIGYFVDQRYDSGPWGVLGGAAFGLTGGMYNMVRASLAAMRDATAKPDSEADGELECSGSEGSDTGDTDSDQDQATR